MHAFRVASPLLLIAFLGTTLPAGDAVKMRRARLGARAADGPVTDDMRAAAQSANAFAFDLYAQLKDSDDNLFASPLGLWAVLTIASAGAEGETRQQMADVLHSPFPLPEDRWLAACGRLIASNTVANDGASMTLALRIWTAWDRPPMRSYLTAIRDACEEWPVKVDFRNPTQAARKINEWVSQITRGRIEHLVASASLPSDTQLLLTSASYFDAKWVYPFQKERTKEDSFRLIDGSAKQVRMMHQTESFRYGETKDYQLVELPYRGDRHVIVILLPRDVGLDQLDSLLTPDAFARQRELMKSREVVLSLPRFSLNTRLQLRAMLSEMGMPLGFTQAGDFSRISPHRNFHVTDVAHVGTIQVDEDGTIAATATMGGLGGGAFEPKPPVEFRVDRPFAFLILDERTDAILYFGRVMDPSR